jgi:hypothetical protein
MLGEFTSPDLTNFFELFILNRNYLSNGLTFISAISSGLAGLVRGSNNLKNARLNISNEMFAVFLSEDMTYSSLIWLPKSDPKSASETLYDAQMRKLARFIDDTHIISTDHVLEIGTGWGSFAMRAVQRTGCSHFINSLHRAKRSNRTTHPRRRHVRQHHSPPLRLPQPRDPLHRPLRQNRKHRDAGSRRQAIPRHVLQMHRQATKGRGRHSVFPVHHHGRRTPRSVREI